MKNILICFLAICASPLASASECAVEIELGLIAVLEQEATLSSVSCQRNNADSDLEIEVILTCSDLNQSVFAAAVDRTQGDSLCGVYWIRCGENPNSYVSPVAVSGKSAAEDFGAIRNACSDIM